MMMTKTSRRKEVRGFAGSATTAVSRGPLTRSTVTTNQKEDDATADPCVGPRETRAQILMWRGRPRGPRTSQRESAVLAFGGQSETEEPFASRVLVVERTSESGGQ